VNVGEVDDGVGVDRPARSAPRSRRPTEAVGAALEAAATAFTPERRQLAPRLQAVIAANSELQERDALKHVGLAKAMSDALQQRGLPDPAASLAAELGVLARSRASARWTDPANDRPLGDLARQSLQELRAASAALG